MIGTGLLILVLAVGWFLTRRQGQGNDTCCPPTDSTTGHDDRAAGGFRENRE